MESYSPIPISKTDPILVTGSAGFVGKNLVANLHAAGYGSILEFDLHSPEGALEAYAARASFVFHLAGVNRPQDTAEFQTGNAGLTQRLLQLLQQRETPVPFLLTSSAQAGNGSDYALSKQAAEQAAFAYQAATGSPVFVYRMPGVFGKWSRPAYNSVVATFCHNIARGIPVEVRDPDFELPLIYIDDVVAAFLGHLSCPAVPEAGSFCSVEPIHLTTLGFLAGCIQSFKQSRSTLSVPDMKDPLVKKLYATYLSFLPETDFSYPLKMNCDDRGSFTEFLRTEERGQVSVNISRPGITKGNHWHNTKNEKFLVVQGQAVIRLRKVGKTKIIEIPVSSEQLQVVDIPTGYTHTIENTGEGDLVTLMWANEPFNPEFPDTFFETV